MIQVIFWDMGGVLFNHTVPYDLIFHLTGIREDKKKLEDLFFNGSSSQQAELGLISAEEHWKNIKVSLQISDVELTLLQEEFWGHHHLVVELVDIISTMRDHYRMGVISNAWSDLREVVTNKWKFMDNFEQFIVSSEIGHVKPSAEIFEFALRQMNIRSCEAIFIDDTYTNVLRAAELGFQVIYATSPNSVKDKLVEMLLPQTK